MNRNVLKIIGIISMLIDHIGLFFFPEIILFRMAGRLAFPIFAFFIAEGIKYTKNIKKYILLLIVFALISQIPYLLLFSYFKLNILFTFLISILLIKILESKNIEKLFKIIYSILIFALLLVLEPFAIIEYGILGVLLVLIFYICKNKKTMLVFSLLVLMLLGLKNILIYNFTLSSFNQFYAILSLLLILFYNNKLGKYNLKYLFYVFYPLHLFVAYFIILLI